MQRAVHQERTRALNERSAESISIPPAPVVGFKDGAAADHAERAEGSHPEQVKPGQGYGTGGLQEHAQGNASDQVRATPNWQSGHSVTGDEARYDDVPFDADLDLRWPPLIGQTISHHTAAPEAAVPERRHVPSAGRHAMQTLRDHWR